MSQEIRAQVETITADAAVTFSAVYRGEKRNALNGKHAMDEWSCEFTNASRPNEPEEFAFFTGLGRRVDTPASSLARVSLKGCNRNSIAWQDGVVKQMKPAKPHAADVLHSLILDSSAAEQSFASWCDDCGYDTDSRKALSIYEACQRNADKLRRLFNANDLNALQTALQDY